MTITKESVGVAQVDREAALATALCLLDTFGGEGLGHVYGNGQELFADKCCESVADAFGVALEPGWYRDVARLSASPEQVARVAIAGIADDYMTSEAHHPGYVLIPSAKFEQLCAAASPEQAAGTGSDEVTLDEAARDLLAAYDAGPHVIYRLDLWACLRGILEAQS